MSRLAKKVLAVALGSTLGSGVAAAVLWVQGLPPIEIAALLLRQARLDALRPAADRHRERVLASLEGPAEPWAGAYAWANGHESIELDLGPAGFYYESRVDYGSGTVEVAYGNVASIEGGPVRLEILEHLVVLPDEIASDAAHQGRRRFLLCDEVYSIPWSGERFLVPAELMPEFCSLAKGTGYDAMRYADYPHEGGPWRLSVHGPSFPLEGLPDVPPAFRAYLPD